MAAELALASSLIATPFSRDMLSANDNCAVQVARSDASVRLFRQHPVSQSGVSGHLKIVAA